LQGKSEEMIMLEDFRNSGWKKVLSDLKSLDYVNLWQSFSNAAKAAEAKKDTKAAKIFRLFSDACSMRFAPQDPYFPFQPILVTSGRRTPKPEDFSEEDLQFLTSIVNEIDEPLLQARIADLLWIRSSPKKDFKMAILAIEAYQKILFREKSEFQDDIACMERAMHLAKSLGSIAQDHLLDMEKEVLKKLTNSTVDDRYIPLKLARLLRMMKLGRLKKEAIAAKLEELANAFEKQGDFLTAADFFQESFEWFKLCDSTQKTWKTIVSCAEMFVNEAHKATAIPEGGYFIAARHLETAIQKLRSIPRHERGSLFVDERIEELRHEMHNAQLKSAQELQTIKSPPIDLSELVDSAKERVVGKSLSDAIYNFCNICDFNFERLASSSRKDLELYLHTIIPADYISTDGRVVAKRPGRKVGEPIDDQETERDLQAQMVQRYLFYVTIWVCGSILPALQVLQLEHPLQIGHFMNICVRSPVVSVGREGLFAKGLYAGYIGDYVTSLHILSPQIEHTLRTFLKESGAKTTVIDSVGIETECGLSTLVDLPETKEILGAKYTFELKSLFCDEFGPNLRNEIAHGLLEENGFYSTESIYAWWWILSLVVKGFFMQAELEKKREDL